MMGLSFVWCVAFISFFPKGKLTPFLLTVGYRIAARLGHPSLANDQLDGQLDGRLDGHLDGHLDGSTVPPTGNF